MIPGAKIISTFSLIHWLAKTWPTLYKTSSLNVLASKDIHGKQYVGFPSGNLSVGILRPAGPSDIFIEINLSLIPFVSKVVAATNNSLFSFLVKLFIKTPSYLILF